MRDVVRYFIKAYKAPKMNMMIVTTKANKLQIVLAMNLILALLLSVISCVHYFLGFEPVIKPFLILSSEHYYLYQGLFILPLMFLSWILSAGVLYLLSIFGKSASRRFFFDDALVIIAFGWTLPWLILMIIPSGLIYSFTGILFGLVGELIRRILLPFIWQVVIQTIGIHEIFKNKWGKSIWISFMSSLVFYLIMLIFVR